MSDALGATYGEDALLAASTRTVAFRRFRAADVRSILAAGAGTPQPRPAGEALILHLPTAPTPSLDDRNERRWTVSVRSEPYLCVTHLIALVSIAAVGGIRIEERVRAVAELTIA